MKKKALKRTSRRQKDKMKGSLARHLTVQLGQVSLVPLQQQSSSTSLSNASRFQDLLDSEATASESHPFSAVTLNFDGDSNVDERDFILSQDFFCTPDYITPDAPPVTNYMENIMEETPCPKSPEKLKTARSKRQRQDSMLGNSFSSNLSSNEEIVELAKDILGTDEIQIEKATDFQRNHSYVSQSAVALRCRVMPPPCLKNPYLKDASEIAVDTFGNMRAKCAGLFSAIVGGDSLSRYRTDFHEIEQIGSGNFSHVFKVFKRIDGCMYAVKHSTRQLHQDTERRKALMEVQALAALGYHENVVGYYSSWLENEQLFIQMELCDHSLSIKKYSKLSTEGEILLAMHQIVKALEFIHDRGIAHLDVKPENIYVKHGVYKLGDFGCATLLDKSLPIEEGDARYMPQEILNDNYDHLDKVDIFSLGAAIFEVIRGSALPESGPLFLNLREGKLPLLPGHSIQFQNLLKVMMDPNPARRPSAKELLENPIFGKVHKNVKTR